MLTPYLLYIKAAVALAVVIALAACYLWISSAFKERDSLRVSKVAMETQIKNYVESAEQNRKLQEGIEHAIKNIRVVSNNYIQSVETGPGPVVVDGDTVSLVTGGVLQTVPSMPAFTNATTAAAGSVAKTR